jgi:hypothetical protein
MILKIINVFPPSIRNNLNDQKLVDLFDKLEQDPEECSKATALELVKAMGDDYKSQIETLNYKTDLTFLYITKDTKNNCIYANSDYYDLKIDIDDIFNNDSDVFVGLGDAMTMIPYCGLVVYAIV